MNIRRGSILPQVLVALAVVALGLACLGMWGPVEIVWRLMSGWAAYPLKVFKNVTIEWNAVMVAIGAAVLFTGGLHLTLRRWRPWALQKTVGIALAILFAFVAGTSMIGIAHQLVWIGTSQEKFFDSGFRDAVNRSATSNNLKHIGQALYNYHDVFETFPPSATYDADGRVLHSWQTILTPYIDSNDIIVNVDLDRPWYAPENQQIFSRELPVYLNSRVGEPKENAQGYALSHYAGNIRVIRPMAGMNLEEITDGTANTILAGEVGAGFRPWADPRNVRDPLLGLGVSPEKFGFSETEVTLLLFCDGSTKSISPNVDPEIFKALGTPDGGEEIVQP